VISGELGETFDKRVPVTTISARVFFSSSPDGAEAADSAPDFVFASRESDSA
jgi:hypothetical protein